MVFCNYESVFSKQKVASDYLLSISASMTWLPLKTYTVYQVDVILGALLQSMHKVGMHQQNGKHLRFCATKWKIISNFIQ